VAIAELLIAVAAAAEYGLTLEALQAATRFSGRLSLVLFSLMFLMLPKQERRFHENITPRPFHLFAFAHGIHLIELLAYVYLAGIQLIPYRLAGGMLAYSFIFIMPVLHNRQIKQTLNERRYRQAMMVYLYYLWLIFFMTYLPRVQGVLPGVGGSYGEFVILLAWVSLIMGVRLSSEFFGRRRPAANA
jgi:hypothetical protein